MEAKQPERGGGTMPRLDCLAVMEALAKVAGGVTGQGFGTAGTPWKGWDCDLCVAYDCCRNLLEIGIPNVVVIIIVFFMISGLGYQNYKDEFNHEPADHYASFC